MELTFTAPGQDDMVKSRVVKIRFFLITVILLLLFPVFAFSIHGAVAQGAGGSFFVLRLDYNNGAVSLDLRDSDDFRVKRLLFSGEEEEGEEIEEDSEGFTSLISRLHSGEVVSAAGEILASFKFDPVLSRVDTDIPTESFKSGKIDVVTPYFPNAAEIKIYDPKSKFLFSVDVAKEETSFDVIVTSATPSQTPMPIVSRNSLIYLLILLVITVVVVVLVIWAIIKRNKSKNEAPPSP